VVLGIVLISWSSSLSIINIIVMKVLPLFLCLLTSSFLFWGCSGDSEVDAYLDSYEEAVEEFESMSQKGSLSASDIEKMNTKNADFLEKANELQSGSDWSVGQFARYQELTNRFSEALSNMN
jgi:hypothetical protein